MTTITSYFSIDGKVDSGYLSSFSICVPVVGSANLLRYNLTKVGEYRVLLFGLICLKGHVFAKYQIQKEIITASTSFVQHPWRYCLLVLDFCECCDVRFVDINLHMLCEL